MSVISVLLASTVLTNSVGSSATRPAPAFVREYIASYRTRLIPAFARKYDVACSMCHLTIPTLNEFGYKFRARGFRMPRTLGKDEQKAFSLGDNFSARIQPRFDVQATNQPNGAPIAN